MEQWSISRRVGLPSRLRILRRQSQLSLRHHASVALQSAAEKGFTGLTDLMSVLRCPQMIAEMHLCTDTNLLWRKFVYNFHKAFSRVVERFNEDPWEALDQLGSFQVIRRPNRYTARSNKWDNTSVPFQIAFFMLATPAIRKDIICRFLSGVGSTRASTLWESPSQIANATMLHFADLLDYAAMDVGTALR